MNEPFTSKKQAMSSLRRDEPALYGQYVRAEERQKASEEKLRKGREAALKESYPMWRNVFTDMESMDEADRPAYALKMAKVIGEHIDPTNELGVMQDFIKGAEEDSYTEDGLKENHRELDTVLGKRKAEESESPLSPIGKLRDDYNNKKINRAEYELGLTKLGGNTVNVGGGESAYSKKFGEDLGGRMNTYIETGNAAVSNQESITQLRDLLLAGTPTGTLQPFVKVLQGIASDIGVDFNQAATDAGVDVGSLAQKEEFDRITTEVIINGFEKFKGNLNQKEVDLAVNAFANLGKSEDGNKLAVASLWAASELARLDGLAATSATTQDKATAVEANRLKRKGDEFTKLRKKYMSYFKAPSDGIISQGIWDKMSVLEKDGYFEQ